MDDMAKRNFLQAFFEQSTSQAMIFVNEISTSKFLEKLFADISKNLQRHLVCKTMSSDLRPSERDQRMKEFRAGAFTALICTNVAARGVDIPEVDIVINYDIPVKSDCFY